MLEKNSYFDYLSEKNKQMKNIFLILLVLLLGMACSKQVKKTQQTPKKEMQSQVELPAKSKSNLEIKRERIRQVMVGNDTPYGNIMAENGLTISTRAYDGKLLVIDFWATWCGPCLQGAPRFKELGDKYRSDKVEFISVSIDRDRADWHSFLVQQGWSSDTQFWMGMDKKNPLFSYLYKEVDDDGQPLVIIGVPKYVIISPQGKILDNEAEFPTNPAFEAHIKRLIHE